MTKPKYLPEYVATLQEYLNWIDFCHSFLNPDKGKLLFRGHTVEGWTLTPSAFRMKRFSERNAIKDYIHAHSGSANYLANIEGILLGMQQNGFATRLLEWSVSPLLALYHACRSDSESDGVVYCLDPWVNKDIVQSCYVGSEDVLCHARLCLALGWTVGATIEYVAGRFGCVLNKSQLENPVPFILRPGNDRERCFMVWGSKASDLKGFKVFEDDLLEIRIRKEDKKELIEKLNRLGIICKKLTNP